MKILFDGRVCCDHFTGVGRYVDDFHPPGLVHVAFLRSIHAHARIRRLEVSAARAAPGVVAVVTGPDVRQLGPLPVNPRLPNSRFDWDLVRCMGNVTLMPCAGSGVRLLDPLPLHSIARRIRPDLLQAPYFTSAVLSPVRSVVTIHDVTPFTVGQDRWRHAAARWGIRTAARSAAFVITPTEAVRTQVIDRFAVDPARIVSIPEGVEPLPEGRLPDPALAASPYVLFVGVHKPHKNLRSLVEAFSAGPCSTFTARLRRRAAALGMDGRVVFTGPLDDSQLGALYRGASALALVSFEEGFGLPLAEAMSMRVPVVASDLPVLREVCGEAALYADPSSPSSIALALAEALARRNGAAARLDHGSRRAAALSWPALAPRYAVCYANAGNA